MFILEKDAKVHPRTIRRARALVRRAALLGAVVALPLGLLVASAAQAVTTFSTSGASVTCNTFIGTAGFKPNLTNAPASSAISVKGTLTGCTTTGATPAGLVVVSGKISGTLTNASGSCPGLLAPNTVTGNLVTTWKVGAGQKLDFPKTTVAPGVITGALFIPGGGFGAAAYGQFSFGGTLQPMSAFAGGIPKTAAATSEDVNNILAQCGAAGLKTVHLGIATATE